MSCSVDSVAGAALFALTVSLNALKTDALYMYQSFFVCQVTSKCKNLSYHSSATGVVILKVRYGVSKTRYEGVEDFRVAVVRLMYVCGVARESEVAWKVIKPYFRVYQNELKDLNLYLVMDK
jgi:hypothetical protein